MAYAGGRARGWRTRIWQRPGTLAGVQPTGVSESTEPAQNAQLRPPQQRVSPRARWYWFGRALPIWVVLIAVEVTVEILNGLLGGPWVLVLVGTVLAAVAHLVVMPQWRFRVHRWEVTDEAVYTQAGWFTQERRIAPISRVQTVDTSRGPVEQIFGLSNVTVTTASSAGALHIDGLERGVAEQIVDHLTSTTQATRGDAT